jgi:hypothetical protein
MAEHLSQVAAVRSAPVKRWWRPSKPAAQISLSLPPSRRLPGLPPLSLALSSPEVPPSPRPPPPPSSGHYLLLSNPLTRARAASLFLVLARSRSFSLFFSIYSSFSQHLAS